MKKATRLSFGEELALLGAEYPAIVVLDADLSKSTQSHLFASRFPDRFFEMGIQEQNMIGTAAGLANMGKKAFLCSFSTFITGRFDAIRMSIAYPDANAVIVGTHCGIGVGEDGYSQMALEDIALMRSLPGMAVLQPADDRETRTMLRFLMTWSHPAFLRLTRQSVDDVHDDSYTFRFGAVDELKPGGDATIFCTGAVVAHALEAARRLAAEGLDLRVVNVPTIKPLDIDGIIRAARDTGFVFTVEDHNVIGGLGSAVAEVLGEHQPTPMKRIGIYDTYGESGTPEALYHAYRIDTDGIAQQVRDVLAARQR